MSFINAGNEAVRAAYKARAAAERNKPKYDKFGKQAIEDQTKQDLLSMEIRGRAQQSAMAAKANQTTREINREAKEYVKDQVRGARMAGKLAGGAALLGGAYFMSKQKDEPNEMLGTLQNQIDTFNKRASDARNTYNEADAEEYPGPNDAFTKTVSETDSQGSTSQNLSSTDGWSKLSKVIRFGEGTTGDAGYNTQFTGTKFTDMSKHPRQLRSGGGYTSDAAGAYQFLSTTWDRSKKALGLTDFSPASQEKAGRWLTQQRGVNPDQVFKTKEEFRVAMDKLAPEWASLPYSGVSPTGHGKGSSYYGQGGKSLDQLWNLYQQN